MAASNKTVPAIDAVDIAHEGPEIYDNLWQKFRSITSYLYDNYYEKYDWFYIADDDTFVIVENLRLYVESEEIKLASNGGIFLPMGNETSQTPLFLGRRFAFKGDRNDIFPSGGAGMLLNKAALKALVTIAINQYQPHAQTFSDDWLMACALRELGIVMYDTQDEEGGERFMPFSVSRFDRLWRMIASNFSFYRKLTHLLKLSFICSLVNTTASIHWMSLHPNTTFGTGITLSTSNLASITAQSTQFRSITRDSRK